MDVTRLRLAALIAALSSGLVVSCASKSASQGGSKTSPATVNAGLDALQANPETPVAITPPEELRSNLDAMKAAESPQGDSISSMVAAQIKKQKQLEQLQAKKALVGESSVGKPGLFNQPPAGDSTTLLPATKTHDAKPEARSEAKPDVKPDVKAEATPAATQGLEAMQPAETQPVKRETPEPVSSVKTITKQEPAKAEATKPEAPKASPSPDTTLIELAAKMAAMLREPATAARPRISDAAAMAAIESLKPGSLTALEQPTSTLGGALSVQDRTTLIEARERLASTPDGANAEIQKLLGAVVPKPPLTIARSVLCTRVNGFGNYQPYATNVFRVGTPIRAIVYLELEHFATRAAKEGDRAASDVPLDQQVSVDVSQSISVFQDPSGLLVFRTPPQPITDTSRSKRRDFYLIQTISLPSTLSIGKYNIKVPVKDRTSGSETEAVIPIVVTAQ